MKAYLASVLEDLVGEYVLNISKENLKLAALRGKIKLDNVELDGDLIGSHVLSAVGLSGFGVLSCWAQSLQISVPWTNLDAPTSLEIRGMHLVCVPLLPTTANRMYYGSQSIRTRAKRSALARFERNFFSGRIAGEGPYQELFQDDHNNDGQNLSFNGRRRSWKTPEDTGREEGVGSSIDHQGTDDGIEVLFSNSIDQVSGQDAPAPNKKEKEAKLPAFKKRVVAKIYENLVSSVVDVHIRCEIPEGALNMSLPQQLNDSSQGINGNSKSPNHGSVQRAFAFGLTLENLSVRNMSEDESPHNNDQSTTRGESNNPPILDDGTKTNKKIEIDGLSLYWDDEPSFLISESNLLNETLTLSVATCQRRIAEAMKQMSIKQHPGSDVVASLSTASPLAKTSPRQRKSPAHDYICSNFSLTMLTTTAGEPPEDSLCFAEILPCDLTLKVTSQQYNQYQLLQNAVLSQQRFDTMLHRRPQKSPLEDPRSWWVYAIACVKHRPTSRSWNDVQRIVQCRKVYLELVVKNLSNDPQKGGFHGGLTEEESCSLDELEGLLPIETLLSFHLVALRRVYAKRTQPTDSKKPKRAIIPSSFPKKRSSTLGRLLNSVTGSASSWQSLEDEGPDELPMFPHPLAAENSESPVRLKQKRSTPKIPTTQTTSQLHGCKVKISLLENVKRRKIVTVEIDIKGTSYNSGSGKADLTFDVTRFEVFDFATPDGTSSGRKVMAIAPDDQGFDCKETVIQNDFNLEDGLGPLGNSVCQSAEMRLPHGVVCRATAIVDVRAVSLDLSAHPATLIWSKSSADSVADFFSSSTHQMQNNFLKQLRNAATPESLTEQMALFFPTSLSISVDVHAPRLWIPVSQQMLDGALFLDAGKLKMVLKKAEQSSESNWNIICRQVQIMLAGETTGTVLDGKEYDAADLDGVSRLRKELTTIVHPFQIDVDGHMIGSLEEQAKLFPELNLLHGGGGVVGGQYTQAGSGQISVKVGRIRLNLVDVEMLAKAIGRFYASGVVMIKNKSESEANPDVDVSLVTHYPDESAFDIVKISFDKLEMALERYSSQRTYLVEVHCIKLDKKNKGKVSFSRLSVSDFTIVQLADANCNQSINVRYLTPSSEPQHQLLARKNARSVQTSEIGVDEKNSPGELLLAPLTPTKKDKLLLTPLRTPKQLRIATSPIVASPADSSGGTQFIKGCHFHDGENHIDEVEIDISEAILKVTPTSISDCTIWLTRAVELIHIGSKEMERRVHDRGRKARTKEKKVGDFNPTSISGRGEGKGRCISSALQHEDKTREDSKDSSIIFRITFKEAAILIGRPASEFSCSRGRRPTDYVVQAPMNVSIITQSIENINGTGSRTFHISMNDFSASVNPDFQYAKSSDSVLLNPTAVDCRAVYNTMGEGHVSSQDFSFDCECMKFCLNQHDIRVVSSVVRKITERLKDSQTSSDYKSGSPWLSVLRSKKKGSRIATRIRAEMHSCSVMLIRSFKSKGMRPFIEFEVSQVKVGLEGCIDAMSGEVAKLFQVKYFNPESGGWEDIISPSRLLMAMDQIPNEVSFCISSPGPGLINVNLTGGLMRQISDLERSGRHSNNNLDSESKGFTTRNPQNQINFANETGFDVSIGLGNTTGASMVLEFEQNADDGHVRVPSGGVVSINSSFPGLQASSTLFISSDELRTIHNLPLFSPLPSKHSSLLYKWHPSNTNRSSIEPVVEFVMQNQRLRSDITDVYSLERGQDLLSSDAWSPVSSLASKESALGEPLSDRLWLSPYLKDDAHDWSDMANVVNSKKSDFVLPDDNWLWVGPWEVEVNGDLRRNDADGWEYAADFETFSIPPRSYLRGDLCRRRRWTRTRMMRQHQKNAKVVWDVGPEENGSTIKARSHVQFHNHTNVFLSFFGSHILCEFTQKEEYMGNAAPGQSLCVPIRLASATHMRLAIPKQSQDVHSTTPKINGFFTTESLMILPSGFTSNRIIRSSISLEHDVDGFLSIKKLHFLLILKCAEGVVNLDVEPALKVTNLLPCRLQCQLGEIGCSFRRGNREIVQTEVISLDAGKEEKCLSVDCHLSPHIAARLPGYKWSYWKKIVCREPNSYTWRPTEEEEMALFESSKDSAEHATEFKSIVHFDHKTSGGDSIDIVMSIEMGHSPVIKFYSTFWVLDKTGLGLRVTGGFSDLLATAPEGTRKSYLSPGEARDRYLKLDMEKEGHEWSLGMNGMTLFFSRDEKIALSVEGEAGEKSQWTSLIDCSNAMPETVKTAVYIDCGTRRYELAYNVTLCPSIFSRTRIITIFPRFQIVNLLAESLYIAQDGALSSEICIPQQSSIHFHWEKSSLAPKVRLCSSSGTWSRGCIQLDKIGVTAMRLPSTFQIEPMVVQAEVRLATKKQDSAIVVTVWASIEKSNPLYLLKNMSQHTIFCRQKLSEDASTCDDDFIWTLDSGESTGFGFDDPELPHVLQWTWSSESKFISAVEVDAMGSRSFVQLPDGGELTCEIKAEKSTKVILFSESTRDEGLNDLEDESDDEIVALSLRMDLTGISVSVIDNASNTDPGREILYLTTEGWHISFCQSREGFHEIELRLRSLQMDNFVFGAEHPVLIHCSSNEDIPFLHLSAVRSIQEHSETLVFSYVALRVLDIFICLDRKTAETIAHFLHPLRKAREEELSDEKWVSALTTKMKTRYSRPNRLRDIEKMVNSSNSGRIYLEKLHLHPIRLSLTFTQEGLELNPVTEGLMVFQLIRGMASIADAPLIFTSFVVSHAFESPQSLLGIISAHYSSQLSSQILTILGSLVILKAPADILSNVGAGVRDFFYEPINGLVHGPAEFLEGLESGTSSLARGVFTGLVRGTASVTELVNHNLANLTSDDAFIDERNAYQKKLLHALKVDQARRTIQDSLVVAGACVARGFQSGANGIFEQPSMYASRHGTAGLVKGMGKAVVGALVKPVVGVGDAAVVVMNHVSETTNDKPPTIAKANKRLRRALPYASIEPGNNVKLIPYDERSAKAQQIVTRGETEDDAYLGHVHTPSHLIIASNRFLWIISNEASDPRRIRWAEISDFGSYGNHMKIDVFSGQGPRSFTFEMSSRELKDLFELLSVKINGSISSTTNLELSLSSTSKSSLPGIKAIQVGHVFGSVNKHLNIEANDLKDETKFIEKCYKRVNRMGSFMPNLFQLIDQEAWLLISSVGQMFTGLSSRRCIAVGIINGTGENIQVQTAKLAQGGSPCYTIPTQEYDKRQGILHPGGAIIFFGWGSVPNLLQPGNVLISIETNFFVTELSDSISQSTIVRALPSWQASFLEKSYDDCGWWSKYWIMARKRTAIAS